MTRPVLVRLTEATSLPGDEPMTVTPADREETRVEPWGDGRFVVHGTDGTDTWAHTGPVRRSASGSTLVEVVVDGWRFEVEVEDAARGALRRRATRAQDAAGASGPTDIRAIIPGRVAAIRVVAGEAVEAGQSLLVIEAMKMQNELRAPRAGTVERVAVVEADTIDNGDLLVVLR
jgi:biotin carboxyl carrier protein